MKRYEEPNMQVNEFAVEDVVTVSGITGGENTGDLGGSGNED